MMKKIRNDLICPECRGPLTHGDAIMNCLQCERDYRVVSNIPCLTNGSSNWRFSISTVAKETIDVAKKKGWQAGLAKLDKERAEWVHGGGRFTASLLASPKGFALDAGCGWGGLTFWLAREFAHVYALDSQLDGLQFIDIRASQEEFHNITTTQGSLLSLPFPDGFFDVVVLNGVLEWVGTFSKEQPPLILQQRALKEIARVLQPNGTLFIAIENRLGLQYFLGYKEEHTGLRFISLLPRRFAQVLHRHLKGQDFRALTHSRPGLEKILKACGFSKTEWFSIYPSYRNCRYATSLAGHGGLKFILRNFLSDGTSLQHALLRLVTPILLNSNFLLKMASFFSPSWGVFASRNAAPQLCLQEKETPIVIKNSDDTDLVITVTDRRANIFQLKRASNDLHGKYTIPLNKQALKKIELSYSCIQLIRKLRPDLSNNLPEIQIYSGNTHLFDYTKGMTGYPLNIKAKNDLQLFFDFLLKLSNIQIPNKEIKGILKRFDIRDKLTYLAYEDDLNQEIFRIIRRPQIIHGDLNKSNVLISRNDSAKVTINDFEHAKIGPGILNWYDFLLRNFVIYGSMYPIKAEVVLHRCTKLPGNHKSNPVLNKMTAIFLDRCHIQVTMHKQLIILYMRYLCHDPIISDPDKVIAVIKSGEYKL